MRGSEQDFDVVVIGGGVIGLCSAYYLQEQGRSVAVIDKGDLGSGSSSGNAGLVVPSHFVPMAAPGVIRQGLGWMLNPDSPFYIKPRAELDLIQWLWKFAKASNQRNVERCVPILLDLHLKSLALYEELHEAEAVKDFGFERNGLLMLYRTEAGEEECQELTEMSHAIDLPAQMLTPEQVSERVPNLELTIRGGTWLPKDAHLNPAGLILSLRERLTSLGTTFFTHQEVKEFKTEGGHIRGIETQDTSLSAKEFVLASGAWSPGITKQLGLNVPIQAAKGYSLMAPDLKGKLNLPLILTDSKVAVTPLQEGVRFAGTLEMAGIDTSINPRRVRAIQNAVPQFIPGFKLPEERLSKPEVWAGLRPLTPDGLPIIGRAPRFENLIVAAGHGMMGVSLAPVTGKLVSDLISGSAPMAALAVSRF